MSFILKTREQFLILGLQKGLSRVESLVLLVGLCLFGFVFSFKGLLSEQHKADESVFSAAASLASGVLFAHQHWKKNGFKDGDEVDNLAGFRHGTMNMTFNGWPRGQTDTENHTNMTMTACTEIWQGLVEDRLQPKFEVSGSGVSSGVCRYQSVQTNAQVEYDVKRGRVKLEMG